MRTVSYVDIAGQHAGIKDALLQAAARVIERGQFVLGAEVEAFERKFAELCEVPFAVGVNSGTDALILALRVLGIGAGDEVITAPNSFVATASAIALVGARPVFVDVRDDLNLDPGRLESAVTARTKAIMPVHLTGRPADMDPILAVARRRGLVVIEDAAQAVGAKYKGKMVGSLGDVGCFSLHPLKTLSACGDGGVLTVKDAPLAVKLGQLRNIGLESRENAVYFSGNSRLDAIQAAFLQVKLPLLAGWTEQRRANAAFYLQHLAGVKGVLLPTEGPAEYCVYHTFVIQADRREALRVHLKERGVETAIHYPVPIHLQSAARSLGYAAGSFPKTESQAAKILSLPVHQGLCPQDLEQVVRGVREFYRR